MRDQPLGNSRDARTARGGESARIGASAQLTDAFKERGGISSLIPSPQAPSSRPVCGVTSCACPISFVLSRGCGPHHHADGERSGCHGHIHLNAVRPFPLSWLDTAKGGLITMMSDSMTRTRLGHGLTRPRQGRRGRAGRPGPAGPAGSCGADCAGPTLWRWTGVCTQT
jgi:hypothetical protein